MPLEGSLSPVSGVGTSQVYQAVKGLCFYPSITHAGARQGWKGTRRPGAGQAPGRRAPAGPPQGVTHRCFDHRVCSRWGGERLWASEKNQTETSILLTMSFSPVRHILQEN